MWLGSEKARMFPLGNAAIQHHLPRQDAVKYCQLELAVCLTASVQMEGTPADLHRVPAEAAPATVPPRTTSLSCHINTNACVIPRSPSFKYILPNYQDRAVRSRLSSEIVLARDVFDHLFVRPEGFYLVRATSTEVVV